MTKFSFIKNIKLNKNSLIIKQMALLIALLMTFIMVVFAWFSLNEGEADADGLSISMGAGDSMLISLDGGDHFVSQIDLLDNSATTQNLIGSQNKLFKDNGQFKLSMLDITSDGEVFYLPKFSETDGVREPDTNKEWTPAVENEAYISQKIIFRTDSPCNIYMGSGTKVTTYSEANKLALASDDVSSIGNKSAAGNFSKDCIVGALRISAIDTSQADPVCRFVCIPRSDIELIKESNADGTVTLTVVTGDAVSGDTLIHTYYDSTYQTTGAPLDFYDTIAGFDGTQLITTTSKKVVRDGEEGYEGTATINIWLEGCDPEVTRIFSGGKYNITFDFVATDAN